MPIDPAAPLEITAFDWVPDFARGYVRDLRPRWACEELGLPYRERLISSRDRPGWYYAEQPFGQVPVIHDGEIQLFESGAILIHLAEKDGRLLPPSGQPRADVLAWLFAAYNSLEPMTMEQASVTIFHAGEDWAEARKPILREMIGQRLVQLADAIGDREWVAGDFSIADIALITVMREFDREGLEPFPTLAAYLERGTGRPAFRRALAAQIAAFSADPDIETKQTVGE
ncbi:glutathione S-transferase family protein [Altererythrobacter xixiisoli]|uniref:Glutathione S-transferase family protein n=1 Tax=Croceibacterium xixiisoli TaxID=1476466 RepID=A0A6I4TVV4_9SPHN|nr:glutathione S-transferase family protein [Croceibacterium xixiisoli]MXO99339.1 glutathione S-transferase family protein [Croceibacterium xixiisoli]